MLGGSGNPGRSDHVGTRKFDAPLHIDAHGGTSPAFHQSLTDMLRAT